MKIIGIVIFLLLAKGVTAQDSTQFVIPVGATINEVLPTEKIYQHPQFSLGQVLYRNGTETEALLNYNILSGNVQFIGPGNDTMDISQDLLPTIKKITINAHDYVYQQNYFEQVEENSFGKLLRRQVYIIANREKMGAYNQYTSTSAISSFNNLTDRTGGFSRSLKSNEKITLALRCEYFFGDRNDNLLPATKKNLFRTFPSKKAQIEDYLKQHKVDFQDIEDLRKLFSSPALS